MDYNLVQLIGVGGDADVEPFVYSLNAPTNLWVTMSCADGSKMGFEFMAHVLNELIHYDCFTEGDWVKVQNAAGETLAAEVGSEAPAGDVQAYQALTPTVRVVKVTVIG